MQHLISKTFATVSNGLTLSLKSALFSEIISNLQLMHIILSTTSFKDQEPLENPDILDSIRRITSASGAFNLFEYSALPGLAYFALIFFSLYFVLFIFLFAITAMQIGKKAQANILISTALSKLSLFHSRVFFFFIVYASFGLIRHNTSLCNGDEQSSQYGTVWLVFVLFFSIDGLGFALIQEFSLYRINKDKNVYASKNNYMHQIMLIHKLLALISHFFFQNTLLRAQITSSIHIIFILCGMYFFYTKLPFYDSRILKVVFFMNAANFAISIISVVLVFGHEFGISRNYLLITGILVMIFHFCLFSKVLQRIREGRIDSPENAIHFAILLKESNLGQLTLPLFERKFCTIPISTIGFLVKEGIDINQVKDGVNTREYERSIYKYLIKKLTLILERHPDSNVLMLYMSDIYCNKLGNVLMAANMLEKIKIRNPSFPVRNSVRNAFVHLKHTCHEMYGNNDIKPEIAAFFAYKSQAEFMRTNVEQETAQHIHLWHELKSKNVSAVKILNLSAAIETIESRILNKYNENKEASSIKFTPFLLIYAIYLQIIKELPSEARKVFKTLQTLATAQTALNIFDIHSEKAGLVILSLNKGQIGTIVGASGSIESLFHMKKPKLIGTTLHNLLPKVIADKYTSILEKCIKGSTSSLENFRTYAKAKGGDYFEVDIKFQLYFHDIHGLSLLVIFQKISNSRSIIIVDNQNLIQEYSKDVQEVLNLEEDKQGPLRLQDILAEPGPASTLFGFIPKSYETPSYGALTYRSQLASSPIRGSWFKSAENSRQQSDETTVFSFSNVKSYNDENPLLNSLYNDFKTRSRSRYVTVISTVPNDSNTAPEVYRSDSMNSRDEDCQKFSQWIKLKFYPLGQRDFPLDYNIQIKPFRFEEKIFKIIVLVSTDADLFKLRENSPTLYLKQTVPDSFADDFPDDDEKPDFSDTKYRRRQKACRLQKKFTLESPAKLPSSHHTRNLSTKLQNMLCADKEQQQAATMILQRFDQTEDRSSKGFYHHRVIRTIKSLKSIFNGKRMHPLSNYSRVILYLVMIFLIILADLNFCWSRDSFTQIEYGLKVTDMANQRLTASVEIWAILLVIYARAIGALPDPELVEIFQQVVYNDTLPLIEDNYQLQKYLEATSEMKFIVEAFHQRVELWATEDNVSKSLLNEDSFIATNLLVNQYLGIANSSDVIELAKTQDYLYTMNNTANGYLLSSEDLISTTHELLSTIIDKNNSRLILILYLTDIGFLVLALMLIAAVWIIAQAYKRLFIVLNKIPAQYIAQRIEQLESIQPSLKFDIHTRDFANHQIQLINKNIEQVKSSSNVMHLNQNNKKEDVYWIREIIKHLTKYVGPAILCILLTSGIFISSVLRTGGTFTALEKVQDQLSVSSDAMYHANMLSASIYSFTLLQNQSHLSIRDGPPDNQISSSLIIMKDISQRLVQTFSSKDRGFDDPVIESLFKDTVCNFITMPEQIASNCAISTQGEAIGLLALVSNYYELSNSYINLYQNNATLSYAQQLLVSYSADMDVNLPVLTFTFEFLNSYILDNLDIKVQAYSQQEVIQLWSILIVIFVSTALIRTVTIRRILHLDVGRRRILKNIPYYMIQESRFMKSFLMREFSEEIVGIKDIL